MFRHRGGIVFLGTGHDIFSARNCFASLKNARVYYTFDRKSLNGTRR